ncbi:ribonuclease HI family protein [candidate division WOR-3 bacterium]|nr:ribonuclease HI family protein [candidate division WOR-3 bacterium]MCK4576921.1 ribonuclease HI family protein [candidate division WOR-3 bacterium]
MESKKDFLIFVDGACKGNPGPAGVGSIVFKGGKIFAVLSKFIGEATNNIAEYTAIKEILMKIGPLLREKEEVTLLLMCDSELIVKQLKGEYKTKNDVLKRLCATVTKTLNHYKSWNIKAIPRSENRIADALATSAVDNAIRALQSK